jgi:Zn-dependent protease
MSSRTLKQIASYILTIVVYAFFLNWKVGLMLIIGIGFHECSHLYAAHKLGMKTNGFYLVPFVGGAAFIEGPYKSFKDQVIVVLGGPIGGGLLAIVTGVAFYLTKIPILAAAANWMALVNLFNLFPFSFLDGGQLLYCITHSANKTLGFITNLVSNLFACIFLLKMAPLLGMMVVIFGGSSILKEYNNWKNYRNGKTYLCSDEYLNPPTALNKEQVLLTSFVWFITAGTLFTLMNMLMKYPEANFSYLFHK